MSDNIKNTDFNSFSLGRSKWELSIIIVNYNVRYFLEQCLHSVFDSCENILAEVIVVDNNSQDSSCEMVKEKFPAVKLINNKKNTGFSTANNQGVTIAKGEYILILNPDTVVAEDTFEKILNFAKSKNNLGAIGVKLIDGTGKFLPESKRGIPTPIVSINKLLGLSSKKYYATYLNENEIGKVEILVGAFMLMKRSLYNDVSGFDEDYFMYGEDIDLSYKISKKGYQNYYFPKSTIIHYKGESTNKDLKYLHTFYNAMRIFYKKHFNINVLFNVFMNLGIIFIKNVKQFTSSTKNINLKPIKKYIYIGKDNSKFDKIKTIIKPEQAIHHKIINIKNILSNKIDTIIFDNNYLPNKDIINTMYVFKNSNIKFRFIPKNCDFIIGSDNSANKGEVINF